MPTRAKDILLVPIILFLTFYFFSLPSTLIFLFPALDDTKRERERRKKNEIKLYMAVYRNFSKNVGGVWFEICCELSRKNIKEAAAYYKGYGETCHALRISN